MTDAELARVLMWQVIGQGFAWLVVIYCIATAIYMIRDMWRKRRRWLTLNRPLKLRPAPIDDLSNSAA